MANLESPQELLGRLMKRSNEDLYSYVNVAEQVAMSARSLHNAKRMDSQVDAWIKKCNPGYEPAKEDDMANILINAGVMLTNSDATRDFMQALGGSNGASAPPTTAAQTPAPPVQAPPVQAPPVQTPPVQTPPVQTPPVQTPPAAAKPMLQTALWNGTKILAPYLVGAGVSLAAASYLMPDDTDTLSEYSIEAIPFEPTKQE